MKKKLFKDELDELEDQQISIASYINNTQKFTKRHDVFPTTHARLHGLQKKRVPEKKQKKSELNV